MTGGLDNSRPNTALATHWLALNFNFLLLSKYYIKNTTDLSNTALATHWLALNFNFLLLSKYYIKNTTDLSIAPCTYVCR
jgi:hypothetical protein